MIDKAQPQEQEEGGRSFKIVDRRRFDLEGNTRADVPEPARAPEPQPPPRAAPQPPPASAKAQPPPGKPAAKAEVPDEEPPMPPGGIDFLAFLQSLGQQALMQLGLVPYPDTGLVEPSLPMARQTIDILAMLQAKTRGNLSPKEDRLMDALVYDLRMAYVSATEATMQQAMPPGMKKAKGPGPGMPKR